MLVEWWTVVVAAIATGMLLPVAIGARALGHDRAGGVQSLHVTPTSRLGGLVVFVAVAFVLGAAGVRNETALFSSLPLVLAALPVVAVGVGEDLTRRVRPRYRMLAAIASAALASAFVGGVVPRVDIAFIDSLLAHTWIVLPLTWFMVAGACNAINLIDGANGLAAGTGMFLFGGIALAAGWSGDGPTLSAALVMMGALAGFLFWNYPHGRIFLGDGGAYFIGFMYAELAIQLVARNEGISAWYVIVLAGYPIVDTLFAMYRRGLVRREPLMAPDALHLHSLIFRRIALPLQRRQRVRWDQPQPRSNYRLSDANRRRANGRVAPRLWLHSSLCFALAIAFNDNTPALWLCLLVYALFYANRYRTLVRFGRGRAGRAGPVAGAIVAPDVERISPTR